MVPGLARDFKLITTTSWSGELLIFFKARLTLWLIYEVHTPLSWRLIHIEPGEVHYVNNPYDEPIVMVSTPVFSRKSTRLEVENSPIKFTI